MRFLPIRALAAAITVGVIGATTATVAHPVVAAAATVGVGGVYVADSFRVGVMEYPVGAIGDVAPARTNTESFGNAPPVGVAVDAAGTLYVAYQGSATVKEYPVGDNNTLGPVRTLGPGNGIYGPTFLAIDPAGNLYVSNSGNNSISVFSYGARTIGGASDGDLPVRTIIGTSTGLNRPQGIALGADGTLYVANQGGNGPYGGKDITVYAPGANGDVRPVRTIKGAATGISVPVGLALDPAGTLYLANNAANTVTEYAPGAKGNVKPIRTISGPATGLDGPYGVALNAAGVIYVTNNGDGAQCCSVTEYAPKANGDARPGRTITGPKSNLSHPTGIVVAAKATVTQTTTTLSASANPATVGEPVTFTAAVAPVPDGSTVSFQTGANGGNCQLVPVVAGKATCTVIFDSADFRCPGATYNGDAMFGASGSYVCVNIGNPLIPTALTTHASASVPVGGVISDTATLSYGDVATGSITFKVFGPHNTNCIGAPAFTSTVAVVPPGNGTYSSGPFTTTAAGVYRFVASYSGDSVNHEAVTSCSDQEEATTVTRASPGLSATASPGVAVGGTIHDTAVLAGGFNPTGSMAFSLYGPGTCSGQAVFTSTRAVNGNAGYASDDFAPAAAGTYHWRAVYSGDSNNSAVREPCSDPAEAVVVTP